MGHKEGKINIPDLELSFSAVLYVEVEKKVLSNCWFFYLVITI